MSNIDWLNTSKQKGETKESKCCPRCGAGFRTANSIFRYYLCGSYEGKEFHQSMSCKARAEGRQPYDMRKSACCGAEIDDSHVIQSGRYKGHGARFCSKCGKVAYIV